MKRSPPLFAGHRVRSLRRKLGLNQAVLAESLNISVSYLSQIESGDRPLTTAVLAALASHYPADWAAIDPSDDRSLFVGVMAACDDPSVGDPLSDRHGVERVLRQHPRIAQRLQALHQAYQRRLEQLRILDESIEVDSGHARRLPWEEVRDWFHVQQNYIDEIDRAAEQVAAELRGGNPIARFEDRLLHRHGIIVESTASDMLLRDYDGAGILRVDRAQPIETTLFSLAYQVARFEFGDVISVIAESGMASTTGRNLLSAGIANYAAGALLMPYTDFREAALTYRHDVDRLRQRFGTSFEQTCHRLSTLQRPGALGLPVFFCRVDMAGNITKRHSATALQFARFGGACPLWIVHEAVAIPDRVLVQRAETPDGVRYVSMAKGLVKASGSYLRPPRRYAVALGCEEKYARDFIYADGLGGAAATPIGSSCRICPRPDCDQRAFPPAGSEISIDPDQRGVTAYRVR